MIKIIELERKPRKLGTKANFQQDREIAQNTPENQVPKISGAYFRTKKFGSRFYYYLVKSYYENGKIIQRCLRYYGKTRPRAARVAYATPKSGLSILTNPIPNKGAPMIKARKSSNMMQLENQTKGRLLKG